jgi:hypothetical protein
MKGSLNDFTGSEAIPGLGLGNNPQDGAVFEVKKDNSTSCESGSRIYRARGINRFGGSCLWRLRRLCVLRFRGSVDPGFRVLFSMSADKLQGFNDRCE